MAMTRMRRSFGTLDLPSYQRSDTLSKHLAQTPAGLEVIQDADSVQQLIQQQVQQMMEQEMITGSNKPDLSEAPWTGPLDPLGDS